MTVNFTDTSTGSPTGWAWYFGDETYTEAWTEVNVSAGWSVRDGHSSVAMPDGSIVLMGGSYIGYKNDTWQSTDNGTTWTLVNASAGWTARAAHTSVAMPDGSIVLMGGSYSGGYYNDVWRSMDNGATWTLVNASAGWTARYAHSSVAMPDGSIVLTGGNDGGPKNDVWRSMDNGTTWTLVNASAGWTARYYYSSVVMPDGSIVPMGGENGGYKNDTWRSMDNGATWTRVNAGAGWTARAAHTSVAMPDGSIVLMGGDDGSRFNNDVWRSMDNGATWTLVNASAGWTARYSHSSVAMPDGSIVLMGGWDSGGPKNDVWRLMTSGSSARNSSHTYTSPGTYQVALQAYNAAGYDCTRKTGYITVTGSPAPVASLTVNVFNATGEAFNANTITIWNGTYGPVFVNEANTTTFTELANGTTYQLMVNRTGFLNVSSNITAANGQRNVTVNLTQLGQLYTPKVILSENGTTASVTEQFYQPPTGEWVNTPANKHPELLIYNLTIAGNESVGVALEFMVRLTVHPLNVKLNSADIPYQYVNGTFTVDDNKFYTTTNATVQVYAPAGSNGKIISLIFSGTLKGDNNNDGVVDISDRAFGNQVFLRQRIMPPAYDYGDVVGTDHVFDLSDVAYITQNFLGQRDY